MIVRCARTDLKQNCLDDKFAMKKTLPKFLFHKSSISNRASIMHSGLKPQVGPSYFCHWDCKTGLKPLVFLYDSNVLEYDTTYDDDIYRIDTTKLDKQKIAKDPDKAMKGCYVYDETIPPNYCEIVYQGSGREN